MPWPVTDGSVRAWLGLHIGPHAYSFIVIRRGDGAPVGMAGFGGLGGSAELGYGFGRRYWNRGYATESVIPLVALAERVDLQVLDAHVFPDNPASVRVLEKAGFTDCGVIERDYPARGGRRAVHHFRIQFPREVD